MKKLTVIGTMGNTQGVSNMANPHRIASRIKVQREPFSREAGAGCDASEAGESVSVNVQSSGMRQASPLQELQVRVPETLSSPGPALRRWVMTYLPRITFVPLYSEGS